MSKIFSNARLKLVTLMLGFGVISLDAQTIQYLNSNNIIAGIGVGGNLFSDSVYSPGPVLNGDLFQTKFDSGRAEIYSASLWMTALDDGGDIHCAAQGYSGRDYFDGPVSATYNSNYDAYYKRVFKVTQSQINSFRNLTFPVNSSQVDSAILYWPAKGNPSVLSDYGVSIDSPLAPYVDVNQNGIYDPLEGDYPGVSADQSIFFVLNDIRNPHTATVGPALGVEIRGLASCFTDTSAGPIPYNKRAINNSVFVQYEVQNKSLNNYADFSLGLWSDPDIGCFDNDFVGCDSARNLMFAYNGTANDPDCSPELGYGSLPVSLGIQILSGPLYSFIYFSGQGAASPAQSDPGIEADCSLYGNYLHGIWGDGSPITYGKDGYNSGGRPTKFCFPGNPSDTSQWSEVQSNNVPGDRRMVGSARPATFSPGQTLNYDFVFTTSYDNSANYISIIDTLKRDADTVRNFYLHRILTAQQVLAIKEIPGNTPFTVSVYPNPANNEVTITAEDNIESIELSDITGRVIARKTVEAKTITLPVSQLAKGVYLVNIENGGNAGVKKIVVE